MSKLATLTLYFHILKKPFNFEQKYRSDTITALKGKELSLTALPPVLIIGNPPTSYELTKIRIANITPKDWGIGNLFTEWKITFAIYGVQTKIAGETITALIVGIATLITAIVGLIDATKTTLVDHTGNNPPSPDCVNGKEKCIDYNRYICINEKWTIKEENADICMQPQNANIFVGIIGLLLIIGIITGKIKIPKMGG